MDSIKTEKHAPNVHRVITDLAANETLTLFNGSDVHFDSPKCDRELLTKHFDEAVERDAMIFINGDWFDVMGCKRDPRSQTNQIRREYLSEDTTYLDAVIRDSFEFLRDYKDNILLIGEGNHESNIRKRKETDPLGTLVFMLNNLDEGSRVYKGGYSGVISFKFSRHGGNHQSKVLQYHHGHGNAPRSKGTLDVDIDAAKWPDADIITKGHTHDKWDMPKVRRRFNTQSMKRVESKQYHLRTGSYKKFGDGNAGWSTEMGHEPKPRGGYWINFTMENRTVEIQTIKAQ